MDVERRPVHRLIACSARPRGVPATVTEASLITHEHQARPKLVTVRTPGRRVDNPLPGRRLHQLAQHAHKRMTL